MIYVHRRIADLKQPWYAHCPGSPVVCIVATDSAVEECTI